MKVYEQNRYAHRDTAAVPHCSSIEVWAWVSEHAVECVSVGVWGGMVLGEEVVYGYRNVEVCRCA